MAHCERCGSWFDRRPSETWKTLCLGCFKAVQREEKEDLERENERLRMQTATLRMANESMKRLIDGFNRHVPGLLKAVHPDVCRLTEAHELTLWLLDLRETLKRGE